MYCNLASKIFKGAQYQKTEHLKNQTLSHSTYLHVWEYPPPTPQAQVFWYTASVIFHTKSKVTCTLKVVTVRGGGGGGASKFTTNC